MMASLKLCKYSYLKISNMFNGHSGYFCSASSSPLLIRGATRHSRNTAASEFHAEAPKVIASEGLAQGPYVYAI